MTANRPDIINKNKKQETCILRDVAILADRNVVQKEAEKFIYIDTTNGEHEMYDYTGNNWSQLNSNKRFKEHSVSHTRKTFNTFTTRDVCTRNTTHNTESTAV